MFCVWTLNLKGSDLTAPDTEQQSSRSSNEVNVRGYSGGGQA